MVWSFPERTLSQHFNMYYTDQATGNLDRDCLSYTVLDDIVQKYQTPLFHYQNILYCFRSSDTWTPNAGNHTDFTVIAFKQLQTMHVTTDRLLKWSAPIDLIERYAAYLQNNLLAEDDHLFFYNCTSGWFGPQCQYSFDSDAPFSAIVKSTFQNRSAWENDLQDPGTTCYMHLRCKYGGSEFVCLDWREVCDGKVDCVDGGIDEKHCFELEMNECEEDEYRCQNGLCVAHVFFRDDNLNPECLDRTDEGERMADTLNRYHDLCASDPSFRCEEHTCKISRFNPAPFACGDGQCSRDGNNCANKRNILILKFDTYAEGPGLCWIVMACLTRYLDRGMKTLYEKWCQTLTKSTSQKIVRNQCPPLFDFPTDLIALGHVRFFYTNNITIPSDMYVLPTYVCYKQELCPFLPSTVHLHTSESGSLTCRHWRESVDAGLIYSWLHLIIRIQRSFRPCSNLVPIDTGEKKIATLFLCPNSRKYISKHRLVDGVRDCSKGEDENDTNSCNLGSRDRWKCPSDGRCLAPTLINDLHYDCLPGVIDEGSDVYSQRQHRISFQTLCDRLTDILPMMINGSEQSDETNCEHWTCVNAYTRDDGIWNCPNGQDELPSSSSITCSSSEQYCISPLTYNLSCLPIHRVNDGQVDCIGGTDELHICQHNVPGFPSRRFLCINSPGRCITVH